MMDYELLLAWLSVLLKQERLEEVLVLRVSSFSLVSFSSFLFFFYSTFLTSAVIKVFIKTSSLVLKH